MKVKLNSSQIGYITELKCKTFLLERGFTVLVPQGNYQKYDLAIEHDGAFHRIQCKHAAKEDNGFRVRTVYATRGSSTSIPYTSEQCDCFMTEFEGEFYIFPVFGTKETKFWAESWTESSRYKNSKIAKDFLAEDYLNSIYPNGPALIPIEDDFEREKNLCLDCKEEISFGAVRCRSCEYKRRGKKRTKGLDEYPIDREELKRLIRTEPFTQLGLTFGVSDKAITKWCKKFDLPHRKKDIISYSEKEWQEI